MGVFTNPLSEYRLFGALTGNNGSVYDGVISRLEKGDHGKVRKNDGWRFAWIYEVKASEREVYKLKIYSKNGFDCSL